MQDLRCHQDQPISPPSFQRILHSPHPFGATAVPDGITYRAFYTSLFVLRTYSKAILSSFKGRSLHRYRGQQFTCYLLLIYCI